MPDEMQSFLELNKQLIRAIQGALDNPHKLYFDNPWENPSVIRDIFLVNLDQLVGACKDNIELLARFQLGLLKQMDFFYFEWAQKTDLESINGLAIKIFEKASSLVLLQKHHVIPKKKCNCHDNACYFMSLGPRYSKDCFYATRKFGSWPMLPKNTAKAFLSRPRPIVLNPGAHLHRVVSIINTPNGEWWFSNIYLNDRSMWRTKLAVTEQMNLNHYYVDFYVQDKPLLAWSGPAASQQAGANCILPGGFEQIWIPSKDIKNIKLPPAQPIKWPLL